MGKSKKPGNAKQVAASRKRSPNYPGISLQQAISLVAKLIAADGKAGAPELIAYRHMGFNVDSGARRAAASALKKFGLIEMAGEKIVPTEAAVTIVRFPEEHPRRRAALRAAALTPTIYKEVLDVYSGQGELPSDASLRAEIEADWDFNPNVIQTFIEAFRDTLTCAGLLEGNRLLLGGSDGATGEDMTQAANQDDDMTATATARTGAIDQTAKNPPPVHKPNQPSTGRVWTHTHRDEDHGPSVRFALPRGNFIEIRMRERVSPPEWEKVMKIFDLAGMAFVEEPNQSIAEENPEDFGYDESMGAQ